MQMGASDGVGVPLMSRTSNRVSKRCRTAELVVSVFNSNVFTKTVPDGNVQLPFVVKAICSSVVSATPL